MASIRNKPMNFNDKCYAILKTIPKGKVTTYKAIALALGSKGYRAVGNAMNKNPYDTEIYPCHRVVGSDGSLTGYAHGLDAKIKRLKSEGIEVTNNKVDLKKFGYFF